MQVRPGPEPDRRYYGRTEPEVSVPTGRPNYTARRGGRGAQWRDLRNEVVLTGLCTGCTSCIVACPFHVLGYENDLPVQLQEEGLTAAVTATRAATSAPEPAHGSASKSEIDELFFGQTRKPEEVIGQYRDIYLARATDGALMHGQDGGVVSALLLWGLRTGEIDGACTSKLSDERQWDAEPTVVTDAEGVLATAGSRYGSANRSHSRRPPSSACPRSRSWA